jgi:hypothetical protein
VQLATDISKLPSPAKRDQADRLEKVAREVVRKEMVVLEGVGSSFERNVDFDDVAKSPGGFALDPGRLTLDQIGRDFAIVVKKVDVPAKEIYVRLEVKTPREGSAEIDTDDAEFWTDYYDFPMIDHTRLSRDQRCAVVIKNFGKASARIGLVYFPGSYASLKEKPYIQEMIKNLLGAKQSPDSEKR